jgi:Mu-like prophage major head subunit gpT
MEMIELIENLRADEAEVGNLFGDAGRGVSERRLLKAGNPRYQRQLLEAANFMRGLETGRRKPHQFEEAMTTSDFPILFADILDRQLLGYFGELTPTWEKYVRKGRVRDFRKAKKFAVDGAEKTLGEVGEREEYPEEALQERFDELSVSKFGRRMDFSWEALINDDLDAFSRTPERLARAARRSEIKKAVQLWVDTKGPHAKLYTEEFKNIIPGNPKLDVDGLQAALLALSKSVDFDGEPISVDMVTLVVPPALEIIAENILHASEVFLKGNGGTEKQILRANNWLKNRVQLVVEPYIPFVATKENGDSTWALFADPNTSRPALEMDYLLGYEDPSLYERLPNARRIGGGGGEVMESFEDDSRAWRIRHVLGGTRLTNTGGAKATVASNGTGV